MAKKMGRPKLPPEKKRKVFPLRFSADELSLFASAAKAKKLSLREWMSLTLTETAKREIK
jgi:predicted HicB family RNase H-like nuclease